MNFSGIFSQIFGQAADHIPIDNPEVAQAVRMMSKMQMHLQGKWRQAQHMGMHCEQQVRSPFGEQLRCVEPMSGTCVACRRPVCLHHCALVPENGDLLCFACIGAAQKVARSDSQRGSKDYAEPQDAKQKSSRAEPRAAEDDQKLRKKFMRRLKLTGEPTAEEIRSAFKREAAKAHPDRAPLDQRDKAHEKFVALGEARDWLLNNLTKKAA